MRFRVYSRLNYQVAGPAYFLLNVAVAKNKLQSVLEESFQTSAKQTEEFTLDPAGKRIHRLTVGKGDLEIFYQATVECFHETLAVDSLPILPVDALPADVTVFLYPSRFCQSDLLARLTVHQFGFIVPGFDRVTAICNWIYKNVEYLGGVTTSSTSAFDTATELAGVCRDFAHLAIAFCRASGIPARFVSSYAYGLNPPDFHAHFEAFLGGRWLLFDASRLAPQASLIRIGTGQDAADTSFATIFGAAQLQRIEIGMQPADSSQPAPEYTIGAISNLPPVS